MPLAGRRWLLAGALGAAAACWAGWQLTSAAAAGDRPRPRPRHRRRVAADTGRGRPLLLFGLPAAGRTALMIRALLARPAGVTVPQPVTDRPASGAADPALGLLRHLPAARLSAEEAAGYLLEVRGRGGYRYGTPLRWDGVVPGEAPLRLVKAPLSELARLRRVCVGGEGEGRGTEGGADCGTEEVAASSSQTRIAGCRSDRADNAAINTPETIDNSRHESASKQTTDDSPLSSNHPSSTTAATLSSDDESSVLPSHPSPSPTRPLLILITVSDPSDLPWRLAWRDGISLRSAGRRVRAAEAELAAALAGESPQRCFDAVIVNDSLDRAARRLVGLIDEELGDGGAGREGEGGERSPTAGDESRMHSARTLWPAAGGAAVLDDDGE